MNGNYQGTQSSNQVYRRAVSLIGPFICLLGLLQPPAFGQTTSDQSLYTQRTYKGTLTAPSAQPVPVLLQISKAERDRDWSGLVIFGYEAGPYKLKTVKFDPHSNALSFTYDNGKVIESLAAKLLPQSDGTLSGQLEGRLSPKANGLLRLKMTNEPFDTKPILEGTWHGDCVSPQGETWHAEFILTSDMQQSRRLEPNSTLEFLPLKVGVFKVKTNDSDKDYSSALAQGSCMADYFGATVNCVLSKPQLTRTGSVPSANLQVVLNAKFAYDSSSLALDIDGPQGKTSCRSLSQITQ